MLADRKLYFITGCRRNLDDLVSRVLSAGVDMIQLRDKTASLGEIAAGAEVVRKRTAEAGALFIVNDYPQVALDRGADGVHLGQDDMSIDEARQILGAGLIIGLSTHSAAQITGSEGVEYLGVGPVFATPTKPGRPPVGTDLVEFAARSSTRPFFAIGGVDLVNLPKLIEAGARRVAVVRALTEAPDPVAVAIKMRRLLDQAI